MTVSVCVLGECVPGVHINIPENTEAKLHPVLSTGHHYTPQEVYSQEGFKWYGKV